MNWIRHHPFATAIIGLLALAGIGSGNAAVLLAFLLIATSIWWIIAKTIIMPNSRSPRLDRLAMPSRPQIARAPELGDVLVLTPGQFEDLTLNLLVAMGFKDAHRMGGSGDLGADVVCHDPRGRSTVVQCKRYGPSSSIGTPMIQTFIGMISVHHRADRRIFVTTVGFSQQAVDLARQHGIALIDGGALLVLLQLTGIPLLRPSATGRLYCNRCGIENRISTSLLRLVRRTTRGTRPDAVRGTLRRPLMALSLGEGRPSTA